MNHSDDIRAAAAATAAAAIAAAEAKSLFTFISIQTLMTVLQKGKDLFITQENIKSGTKK